MNIENYLKTGWHIGLVLLVLTSLSSCLKGAYDDVEYITSADAQLVAFSISNDSVPELAKAKFSINQISSEIYNHVRLPYLTDTAKIRSRVAVSYTTGSGLTANVKVTYSDGDTVWVAGGDSITMAEKLSIQLYAPDGKVNKIYALNIRIHQADPDSVQYRQVTISEVPSVETVNWEEITQHCPYTVVTCLGFVYSDNENKGLALLVEQENDTLFAFSKDLVNYETGGKIPEDFPVRRFSVLNNPSFAGTLTIMKHLTSIWTTENGIYWTNIAGTQAALPEIEGGSAFLYNDEIWFIGGKIVGGEYNREVYYSTNKGNIWKTKPVKTQVPEEFILRKNANVVVDKDGKYFYIIGGRNETLNPPELSDVWKAALNSKAIEY